MPGLCLGLHVGPSANPLSPWTLSAPSCLCPLLSLSLFLSSRASLVLSLRVTLLLCFHRLCLCPTVAHLCSLSLGLPLSRPVSHSFLSLFPPSCLPQSLGLSASSLCLCVPVSLRLPLCISVSPFVSFHLLFFVSVWTPPPSLPPRFLSLLSLLPPPLLPIGRGQRSLGRIGCH